MKNMHKKLCILFICLCIIIIPIVSYADKIVYITETGRKYHNGYCIYLSKSKINIALSNAIKKGYTPCKKCKP